MRRSSHVVRARFAARRFVERTERAYAAVIPQFVEDPRAFEAFVASVTREMEPVLEGFRDGDMLSFPMPTHIALARAR